MPRFLIYGANGYTGELIAREAVRLGLSPVLAALGARFVESLPGSGPLTITRGRAWEPRPS